MTNLKIFCLFFLSVLSIPQDIQEQPIPEETIQEQPIFINCGLDSDSFKLTQFTVTPFPVTAGNDATIQVSGNSNTEITTGFFI